ncbi:glycosyl hydrolase 108 family protein [uncultured Ruegeria sp.]|uniref:glycoside hydrolase family 108 protein n=1 Tax=uncultured Ruegeria sp. TaxID=259304 RepID=UPI002615F643|nr:glycosyl hydrolase 108 family protein [uncultured Ruegeria sp.]
MPATNKNFQTALSFTLKWEGGYVDNPNDPGKATNKGITQKVYDAYRQSHGLPTQSVRAISQKEVDDIYLKDYWDMAKCPDLPSVLGIVQFDSAVNCGTGRAMKFLQQAVGCTADGLWGPSTATHAASCSPVTTAGTYLDERVSYYKAIAREHTSNEVFLKGWLNQVDSLRSYVGA